CPARRALLGSRISKSHFQTIDPLEPPGSVSVWPSPLHLSARARMHYASGPARKLAKNAHQNSWFGGRRWIPPMELRLPQLRRPPQRLFAHPGAIAIADRLLPPPRSLVPGRRLARPALSASGYSGAIALPGQSRPLSPRWRFSPLRRNRRRVGNSSLARLPEFFHLCHACSTTHPQDREPHLPGP